jgi:hypothetical protein
MIRGGALTKGMGTSNDDELRCKREGEASMETHPAPTPATSPLNRLAFLPCLNALKVNCPAKNPAATPAVTPSI